MTARSHHRLSDDRPAIGVLVVDDDQGLRRAVACALEFEGYLVEVAEDGAQAVDRVVKLSNGEFEVHDIGVNWPHHIFVTKNFKVVGAD